MKYPRYFISSKRPYLLRFTSRSRSLAFNIETRQWEASVLDDAGLVARSQAIREIYEPEARKILGDQWIEEGSEA